MISLLQYELNDGIEYSPNWEEEEKFDALIDVFSKFIIVDEKSPQYFDIDIINGDDRVATVRCHFDYDIKDGSIGIGDIIKRMDDAIYSYERN